MPTEKNLGFAGGNNYGLSACSRKYILLLNNDTVFHEDSIAPLITYLEKHPAVAVAQGTLKLAKQGDILDVCGTKLMSCGKQFPCHFMDAIVTTALKNEPVFSAKGAFLLFKSSILKQLDGVLFHAFFVNNFEDIDFCHRVWLAGMEVHFVPTPPVDHMFSATVSRLNRTKNQAQTISNMFFSYCANFGLRGMLLVMPFLILYQLAILFRFTLALQFDVPKQYYLALRIFISNRHKLLAIRRKIQKQRRVSDKQIFKKTLFNPPISYWLHLGKLLFKAKFH